VRRFLISAALVAPLALAGCGSLTDKADFSAVDAFVSGLAGGKVTVAGAGAAKQYQSILTSMGVKPTVTLGSVDKGSAQLHWSWALPGGTWSYDTTVALADKGQGVWSPTWAPSAVIPDMVTGDVLTVTHPRGRSARILASDDKPAPGGSLTGVLSGIEKNQDQKLNGKPGTKVELTHARVTRELVSYAPTDGSPLKITIRRDWQQIAEGILNQAGPPASLVAIQVSTGKILVAANNNAAGGFPYATLAQSPSGSTFKTVDALALIRQRKFTADSTVTCPLHFTVMGFEFKNDKWYPPSALGNVPLRTAIAQSCNTAMISQHDFVPFPVLKGAAATLGVAQDYDLGFPAFLGQLPKPENEFWKAEDMIGQGGVLVSPLTMATDIASIQAGHTVVPWMIEGIRPTVAPGIAPLTPHEDAELKKIFREVVVSGTGAGMNGMPGAPIIGKTGTAEFVRKGLVEPTHTWFIAAQGDLAMCVYVDVGKTGAETSLPLMRQFLSAIGPQ
jgi:cell division protein FtsI/penicillin-binding protein 2